MKASSAAIFRRGGVKPEQPGDADRDDEKEVAERLEELRKALAAPRAGCDR